MKLGKNQNSEALSGSLTLEQKKQKEILQSRIDDLKNLQHLTVSETQTIKKEIITNASLSDLEKRVQSLDGKNHETFQADVEKIETQLEELEKTRSDLISLRTAIQKSNPQLYAYAQVQSQFPESSQQANQGRVKSYEMISSIKPREGENGIANFFAGIVEKLVA